MAAASINQQAPDEVVVSIANPEFKRMIGTIKNVSDVAIHLRLPASLPAESSVTMEFADGCQTEGTLMYCNRRDGTYHAAIYFKQDPNRKFRSQPRFPVTDATAIISPIGKKQPVSFTCRVTDLSKSGIGLTLDRPLAAHDFIKIEMRTAVMFGEVRYCRQEGRSSFHAGVAIETVVFRSENPPAEEQTDGGASVVRRLGAQLAGIVRNPFSGWRTATAEAGARE